MTYSNQRQFKSKIDGKVLDDFRQLDHSIENYNERKKHVDDLLDDNVFFEEYFDNHYNPNINASGNLSEENDVCSTLENMATYLLNSTDVIEEDKKNQDSYVIHKNKERFQQKLNRESVTVFNQGVATNLTDEENVVHFLVNDNNDKKPKKQVVKKSDINSDSETGRVLREYNTFLEALNQKLRDKPDGRRFLYSRAKAKIQDDMMFVKNMLDGVWGYNINGQEVFNPDYDIFDFTNDKTILEMIKMAEPDFETSIDLWITWHEFNMMVDKLKFSEDEFLVLTTLRAQLNPTDISNYTNLDYRRIQQTIIKDIVRKIAKVGNKYDAYDEEIARKLEHMVHKNENIRELFN